MNKLFRKTFIALLAIVCGVSSLQAQEVNMNRYITFTVKQGQQIRLDMFASAADTRVKVVSGSTEQIVTVGTSWTGFKNYLAGSTTMTVYGNIDRINSSNNGTNLTAVDISRNTELSMLWCSDNRIISLKTGNNTALVELYCEKNNIKTLDLSHSTELKVLVCSDNRLTSLDLSNNKSLEEIVCYKNTFTTSALDNIYCALPDYTMGADAGSIFPLYDSDDTGSTAVLASNGNNATAKNWSVQYYEENTDITGFTGTHQCEGGGEVNMERYITLAVKKGTDVSLNIWADAADTPIKIVSGDKEQTITAGTSWIGTKKYTAGGEIMTIYGNVLNFDCNKNGKNITSLDVSHNTLLNILYCENDSLGSLDVSKNTQLKSLSCPNSNLSSLKLGSNTNLEWLVCFGNKLTTLDVSGSAQLKSLSCIDNAITKLDISKNTELEILNCKGNKLVSLDISHNPKLKTLYCFENNFTTSALDDIYCSLPDRKGETSGVIQPLLNPSSTEKKVVLASNAGNATSKNWKVQYYNDTDITGFTGTHQCGNAVNMSRYITLTVKEGENIHLNLWADTADTPIKVVSGDKEQTITAGTDWTGYRNYTAGAGNMTVYGNVLKFDCNENMENITGLDVSRNIQLMFLDCGNNSIATLDVSNNKELINLGCGSNSLSSLDVKNNTKLEWLDCKDNSLTSLDVSHNTQLKWLGCNDNSISMLDIKNNTMLRILYCYNNSLTSLDVANNTQLQGLYCQDNNFATEALDDIFCSLPDRKGTTNGIAQLLFDASSSDKSKVLAANGSNATNKNWKVQYFGDDADITGFTGTHQCGGGTDLEDMKNLPALTVYPNPVRDVLNIATDQPIHNIRIYNVYGTEVLYAADTDNVDISHLPAGVYMVRADGKITRIIKE